MLCVHVIGAEQETWRDAGANARPPEDGRRRFGWASKTARSFAARYGGVPRSASGDVVQGVAKPLLGGGFEEIQPAVASRSDQQRRDVRMLIGVIEDPKSRCPSREPGEICQGARPPRMDLIGWDI